EFDVTTDEKHQVSVLTASGLRPTIGWTLLSDEAISITVALKSASLSWIGLGVASTDGLGASLMSGAGAIIGRFGVVNQPPVSEYLVNNVAEVARFDGTFSLSDVEGCVTENCVNEAQR